MKKNTNKLEIKTLYQLAKESMMNKIKTGEWKAGDALPSGEELAKEYGVSMGTLRRALDEMVEEGLVVRKQGLGSYIQELTPDRSSQVYFPFEKRDGERFSPETKVLEITTRKPHESEKKHLPSVKKVISVERHRFLQGSLIIQEIVTLPFSIFSGLEKEKDLPNNLYPYYSEEFGIIVSHVNHKVAAIEADAKTADLFQVKQGQPLLEISRVTIDIEDRPVELRKTLALTENIELIFSLK